MHVELISRELSLRELSLRELISRDSLSRHGEYGIGGLCVCCV